MASGSPKEDESKQPVEDTAPAGPVDPEEGSTNGYTGDLPSQGDLYMERQATGSPDLSQELITGSGDPVKYLPRTDLKPHEIARDIRIKLRHDAARGGRLNLDDIFAWIYNARPAIGGKRVQQVVDIATAREKHNRRRDNMIERANTINREEIRPV